MYGKVLEQRGREQRCENVQLTAQVSQLTAELRDKRERAVVLDQQLAARDAAAQVRTYGPQYVSTPNPRVVWCGA